MMLGASAHPGYAVPVRGLADGPREKGGDKDLMVCQEPSDGIENSRHRRTTGKRTLH